MPVMFAHMHVCAWLMPTETRRCQVPPELDSLDSENWTQVLCKRIQCPSLLNRFFSLLINLWMCADGLHQLYYPSGGLGLRLISFFCSLHGSLCLGSELFSVGLHRGMCCGNSLSTTNREEGDTWEQGEALRFWGHTCTPGKKTLWEGGIHFSKLWTYLGKNIHFKSGQMTQSMLHVPDYMWQNPLFHSDMRHAYWVLTECRTL